MSRLNRLFSRFEALTHPYPNPSRHTPPQHVLGFCWHYARGCRRWILLSIMLIVPAALLEAWLFHYLGNLVDWLGSSDPSTFLSQHWGALLGMALVVLFVLPGLDMLHNLLSYQTLMGNLPMMARWRMHQQMLGQSQAFFQDEFAGRIATRVMQTSLAIRDTLRTLSDVMIYALVYMGGVLMVVASADWRLMLPVLLWLACYITIMVKLLPRLGKISEIQASARAQMTGRVVDSYTNIQTVKLFAHSGHELNYARDSMDEFIVTVHQQMRLVTILRSLMDLNYALMVFLVGAASIALWHAGIVGLGSVAAAVGITLRLRGMAEWIMWETAGFFENLGVVADGRAMLRKRQQVVDVPKAAALSCREGQIDFRDIVFHYDKAGGVIESLNLSIAPGQKVGIVGRSGAGKTTLCNLLLRLYDLEGGRIEIDGQDISQVTQESLRRHIGVVAQESALLHRSVRENIAYGRQDASEEEIIHAARRAKAWEFIQTLEDSQGRRGLDAHVGERGVKLSGGQRQRIAIARVFLKDAPILVLDEATSALDSEIEAAIQETLFELMEGKTTLVVAHRLSTIAAMDRLIVLDQGRIVEDGSHDELLAQGHLYARLWQHQSGGFLPTIDTQAQSGDTAEPTPDRMA